jgi:Ca2+-transporting ATPase
LRVRPLFGSYPDKGLLFLQEKEKIVKNSESTRYDLMDDQTIDRALKVNRQSGLNDRDVQARRAKYGTNELTEGKKVSVFQKFIAQFKDFLILVLIIAAVISGALGEMSDTVLILLIVVLNAIIGVIQESKAESAMASLKKMTVHEAKVIRNGVHQVIRSEQLVPGDVVLLEAGDAVPADGRLIEVADLKVQESALTGESVPVEKTLSGKFDVNTPLADRTNMVYMHSTVSYGRGKFIVTATGMETEIGKIAGMIQNTESRTTPLTQNINQLGKTLGLAALICCGVVFAVGLLRGGDPLEMFLTAVSLAVAAIPEGLPAIVTVVLALGTTRLAKKNAIIRKLPAVETLGCASVICSDKTGTLTQNRMTIKKVYANEEIIDAEAIKEDGFIPSEKFVVRIGELCNDAQISKDPDHPVEVGDPTEIAMVDYADKLGFDKNISSQEAPRVGELPFDSERKLMTTVHHYHNTFLSFTKGAPDCLLAKCTHYLKGYEILELTPEQRKKILAVNEKLANDSYRVLGYAFQQYHEKPEISSEILENNLVFAGLTGMIDPPREEVRDSVKDCHQAGIKTVMITGDHKQTAVAIARDLEIFQDGDLALSGEEMDQLTDKELEDIISRTSVFARVSPKDKVRIVKAWQHRGEVVAMTGDGVNDAPALKQADIGCAMGITGTDVSKEAADMILTDDNFSTIVSAVKEGRGIYDNIKKAVHFLLSCNIAEILVIFIATLIGLPQPLLPVHILWINLVTDSLPALALGMEKQSDDVMQEKPRKKGESIFANGLGRRILFQGVVLFLISLVVFVAATKNYGIAVGRTMVFCVLGLSQLTHLLNVRSENQSAFHHLFTNRYLWGAMGISVLVQLIVIFIPGLHSFFNVTALNGAQWGIVIAGSIAPLFIVEITKLIQRGLKQSK